MARDFAIWAFHICVLSLLRLSHQPLQVSGRRGQVSLAAVPWGWASGPVRQAGWTSLHQEVLASCATGREWESRTDTTSQKSNSEPFFSFDT